MQFGAPDEAAPDYVRWRVQVQIASALWSRNEITACHQESRSDFLCRHLTQLSRTVATWKFPESRQEHRTHDDSSDS